MYNWFHFVKFFEFLKNFRRKCIKKDPRSSFYKLYQIRLSENFHYSSEFLCESERSCEHTSGRTRENFETLSRLFLTSYQYYMKLEKLGVFPCGFHHVFFQKLRKLFLWMKCKNSNLQDMALKIEIDNYSFMPKNEKKELQAAEKIFLWRNFQK